MKTQQTEVTIETCKISKETLKIIKRYSDLAREIASLEREKKILKAALEETTHHAAHIVDSKGREVASWQTQIRHILDTERFKAENLKLFEAYQKESRFYVFNVFDK